MSPSEKFTLFLPETPQEVSEFHPELSAELSRQRKVETDPNSLRAAELEFSFVSRTTLSNPATSPLNLIGKLEGRALFELTASGRMRLEEHLANRRLAGILSIVRD